MKKLWKVMGVFGLLLLVSGAALGVGKAALSQQEEASAYRFGAIYMTMNNPYFTVIDDEIRNVVEQQGDYLLTLNPALDRERQIQEIEYLIHWGADLIFINPADSASLTPALEKAQEAGIPIFIVDAPVVDEDLVTVTIASDNYQAGVACALDMMARLGAADIVLLEHSLTSSAAARIQGFVDTLAGREEYQIIARAECEGQLEIAMPVMAGILAEHDQIDVIMALNDPSALGALAALEAKNRLDGVLVYGVDGSPDTKALIRDGIMTASAAQSPKSIGRMAVEKAYEFLQGEAILTEYVIPVTMITEENIKDYTINGWQ